MTQIVKNRLDMRVLMILSLFLFVMGGVMTYHGEEYEQSGEIEPLKALELSVSHGDKVEIYFKGMPSLNKEQDKVKGRAGRRGKVAAKPKRKR